MSNFSDPEVDFQTYVAPDYEARQTETDALHTALGLKPPRERELVALGKPKLVRPKRRALDLAVGLLLRTPVPGHNGSAQNRDELAHLERNALAVAKHIGLLDVHHGPDAQDAEFFSRENASEPVGYWLTLVQTIRLMFQGRRPGTIYSVGKMAINLACKSDGSCFMTVRPLTTYDAIIYHAAQMIAKGTISQICKRCGTTFLSGGAGHGKDKKRGDARFCSDECRWKFHNESRRKAR